MSDKFAVIGLGQFGLQVARQLAKRGAEVLAIDRDMDLVERVKDDVAYAVTLDSTDIKALSSQDISDMDAVLVAIGENIEGLLLTTVLLLELKTKRIIARAMSEEQRLILQKIGIREILSPENEVGILVAEMLLNPIMKAFLPLPDNYRIIEITTPIEVAKKTVEDIDFEETYHLKLITIRRQYAEVVNQQDVRVEHLLQNIDRNVEIQPNDMLVIMGKVSDIEKFIQLNS